MLDVMVDREELSAVLLDIAFLGDLYRDRILSGTEHHPRQPHLDDADCGARLIETQLVGHELADAFDVVSRHDDEDLRFLTQTFFPNLILDSECDLLSMAHGVS